MAELGVWTIVGGRRDRIIFGFQAGHRRNGAVGDPLEPLTGNRDMSIWLLLFYTLAVLALTLAIAVPSAFWGPVTVVSLVAFAGGLAKTGVRRPVV